MNRRTVLTMGSVALIALAVFGSAAGAFAAKSATASTSTAAVAGSTTSTGTLPPRDGHGGPGGGLGGGLVEVVAKLTGESTTTVTAARQSGTSFTQIASAKNVTAAQIVELALHAPKAGLDSEVSDALITQAQADSRLAELKTHLTAEVAETALRGPGGHGRGGHDGPPPTGQTPTSTTSSTPSTGATN